MTDPQAWLRSFGTAHPLAASTLVCFPHAGGSAGFFRPLATALAPVADILAVQYPGRLDRLREPPVTDARRLADLVTAALAETADRPVFLFGHSMGAIVAFETARRLTDSGRLPVLGLFVSGRSAPQRPLRGLADPGSDDATLLSALATLGGTDARLFSSADLQRLFLPAIRADFRLLHTYRYLAGEPLTCPITVMVGDRDPVTTAEEAQAWDGHTAGEFRLRIFPGHHFYLTSCCGDVAADLARSMSARQEQWEVSARAVGR